MIITKESDKLVAIERIKDIDLKEGKYEFSLKKKRGRRSLNQNRLFWLWMTALEIDSETGYSKEEFHDIFQSMFCPRQEIWVKDQKIEKIKGTSQLNTKEFKEMLDKIQLWSYHELGISLPQPDSWWFDQFVEHYE